MGDAFVLSKLEAFSQALRRMVLQAPDRQGLPLRPPWPGWSFCPLLDSLFATPRGFPAEAELPGRRPSQNSCFSSQPWLLAQGCFCT